MPSMLDGISKSQLNLRGNNISVLTINVFLKQAEELRKLLGELKGDIKKVKTDHSDILSNPFPDESSFKII